MIGFFCCANVKGGPIGTALACNNVVRWERDTVSARCHHVVDQIEHCLEFGIKFGVAICMNMHTDV